VIHAQAIDKLPMLLDCCHEFRCRVHFVPFVSAPASVRGPVAYLDRPAPVHSLRSAGAGRGSAHSSGPNAPCSNAPCRRTSPPGSSGGEVRIIAFITDACAVRDILTHIGEPTSPPRLMPARAPRLWEVQGPTLGEDNPQAQSAPEYEFDQRITW